MGRLSRHHPTIISSVKHMHPSFADLGALEKHVLDTEGLSSEQVLAKCEERRKKGEFNLDIKEVLLIDKMKF